MSVVFVLLGVQAARRDHEENARQKEEPDKFVSSLPIRTIEEAAELGTDCSDTSKGIYAFLAKHVNRTDEANVLAEYRQKFEAKVIGLHLDLLAGGLSTPDRLAIPAASLDDVHWIAVTLANKGEGYRADRLQKLYSRALKEIEARKGGTLEGRSEWPWRTDSI